MTALSKYVVVANFVFSLVVAGWCIAMYFTRIDWTENTPESPAPFDTYVQKRKSERGDTSPLSPLDREMAYNDPQVGRMTGRIAHLKEQLAQSVPAEAGWREGRRLVRDRDVFRTADRNFYQNEIAFIYNAADNQQLREVVLGKDGQPDLDTKVPTHVLPKLRPLNDRFNQPLHSLAYYAKNYATNLDGLKITGEELQRLLNNDADLTVELAGGTMSDKKTLVLKGLRLRIEDERVKGLDVLTEHDIVKPLLIKTVGDSEFLLARRRQLEKRIKELEETQPVTNAP